MRGPPWLLFLLIVVLVTIGLNLVDERHDEPGPRVDTPVSIP